MAIDGEILGYYIDCRGAWPDSWQWVYTTLLRQRFEAMVELAQIDWEEWLESLE